MTEAEFARGWRLLVLQPWGWRYNQVKNGKPTQDSIEQLDFYYRKLGWADADSWYRVADLFAAGKEWPSIDELKQSLKSSGAKNVGYMPPNTEQAKQIIRQVWPKAS